MIVNLPWLFESIVNENKKLIMVLLIKSLFMLIALRFQYVIMKRNN